MLLERRCPVCGCHARFVCEWCWHQLVPSRRPDAVLDYDSRTRAIVLAAKNGGRRDLWRPLGRILAGAVPPDVTATLDLVTWVPASLERRRQRGYDQAQLLARSVARSLDAASRGLLRRHDRDGQTGRSRSERLTGPDLTLRGSGRVSPPGARGRTVLVVDDVTTTGASLEAARAALEQATSASIVTLALAGVDDT